MIKPALCLAALLTVLAGCAAAPAPEDDGVLRIVASTDVYGDLAAMIAPADARITSIISGAQDPHEYEASGRDRLEVSRADIVIVNGGGYDDFLTRLLEASDRDGTIVIEAVETAGQDAGAGGSNEHVWYDYAAMDELLDAIADAVGRTDPAAATVAAENARFGHEMLGFFADAAASIAEQAGGSGVVVTEPVALRLLTACGLVDLTPPGFSEAIEEDTDVSPALLQSVLARIAGASLVVYNVQTGGPQTDAVVQTAREQGVPLIAVTETLPADSDYSEWQTSLLNDIAAGLGLDPVA